MFMLSLFLASFLSFFFFYKITNTVQLLEDTLETVVQTSRCFESKPSLLDVIHGSKNGFT